MSLFKKTQVADFFLNQENPYSKKRTLKIAHIGAAFSLLAAVVLVAGSALEKRDNENREKAQANLEIKDNERQAQAQGVQAGAAQDRYVSISQNIGMSGSRGGGRSTQNRQVNASQIIQPGASFGGTLPMGSQIRAQILGQVESADSNSPVTALITADAMSPLDAMIIPKGTRVIGSGQLDPRRERLQVRFHTLVFPEGQQFSVSALAMMSDGSSGLAGNFSSGNFRKNASRFLGNFIGGLAQGMKDKTSTGQLGIPMETGGLKNGVLNGIADSSTSYAKTTTDEMAQSGASIIIKDGTLFSLYLEREFHQ